jgi:putative hemolysin
LHSVRAINARQSLTLRDGLHLTGLKRLDAFIGSALDGVLGLRHVDRRYQRVPIVRDAAEFVREALAEMDVRWDADARELENIPGSGPAVIAANHPFGGIEGLLLAEIILARRPDLKILANADLRRIVELRELFIAVNPFETARARRENVQPLRAAADWVGQGGALLIFPSGEVSHFQFRRARITDPDWRPSVGYLARRTGAAVVPAFVGGRNSLFFQLMGCIHPRLRTALLAREFLNMEHRSVRIRFGPPVAPTRVKAFTSSLQLARYLRLRTYSLAELDASGRRLSAASAAAPRASALPTPIDLAVDPARLEREFDALPPAQRLVASGPLQAAYARAGQIPGILAELGRLRETTFRASGEGTGRATDLDRFDQSYLHLFLWHGARREIVGAYRFAPVDILLARFGVRGLYTYSLFKYRRAFIEGLHDAI